MKYKIDGPETSKLVAPKSMPDNTMGVFVSGIHDGCLLTKHAGHYYTIIGNCDRGIDGWSSGGVPPGKVRLLQPGESITITVQK